MHRVRVFLKCAVLVTSGFLVLATNAHAGLGRPPASHIEPLPDGRHMLVFLAPVPIDEDTGRLAELPNGEKVDLRTSYSASGCYEIGSRTPLWTAPWEGIDYWTVSDDYRYLIRWNIFGDGSYRFWEGGRLSWALKLYDRGRETKTHHVEDLVDFPSLMEYTTGDWHHLWLDYDYFDRLTLGDQFEVRTTTHERYVIDLHSGEVLRAFRMWRTLARAGAVLLSIATMCLVAIVFRRPSRDANEMVRGLPRSTATKIAPITHLGGRRFLSFRLRTLFVITTAIALIMGIGYRWPHVALLAGSLIVAALLARRTARLRRERRTSINRRKHAAEYWSAAIATVIVWAWCYMLTGPPVIEFVEWLHAPGDVRMAIILTVYRPFIWFSYYTDIDLLWWLEWYVRAWGQ